MHGADFSFTDAEVAGLKQLVFDFGKSYQRLMELSRRSGVFAFPVTPKVTRCNTFRVSPSASTLQRVPVYREESLMGTITKAWRGSARGPYKAHVPRIVLSKRLVGFLARFELAL